ncbi:MAG: hypothetical protein ACR2OZ_00005 [Verrucomicrobiales bacterium]
MNQIQVTNGRFPISGFGEGQAMLRPSSERVGGRRILHFCCYDPLPVGANGTLLDGSTLPVRVRVIERFGDYYNAEVVEESHDEQPDATSGTERA